MTTPNDSLPTIILPKGLKGRKVESEKYGTSYHFTVTGVSGKYPKVNVVNEQGQMMQLLLISEKNDSTGEWGVKMVLTPVKASLPKSVDLAATEVTKPTEAKAESKAVKALQAKVAATDAKLDKLIELMTAKQTA